MGVPVFSLPSLGFLSAAQSCCCLSARHFLLGQFSQSWRGGQDEEQRCLGGNVTPGASLKDIKMT